MMQRLRQVILLGGMIGLCMLGVEELANLLAGQAPLARWELSRLLPWYLAWPVLLALPGLWLREPAGRLLVAVAGVWALVGGAIVSMVLHERGLPLAAPLGLGLGALLAAGACGVGLRVLRSPRARLTVAVAALVFLPAFRAVNLNAFGSPGATPALVADAGIALLSVLLGLLAGALSKGASSKGASSKGASSKGASSKGVPATSNRLVLALALAPGALAALGYRLTAPAPAQPAAPAPGHPDVVLVVVDTLRADHLGAYGYPRPTSPGIDALAAQGLRYTDATSAAPWTLPSFASLQTGLDPAHHGAGVNPGEHNSQAPLGPELPTVAECMAAAGYRTGAIVSNPYLKASFGLGRGYDHYDDALGLAHQLMLLHPLDELPLHALPDRSYRLAPRMVAAAQQWWAETRGGPRFLMLHLMDPHKPYNAPVADQQAVAGLAPGRVAPSTGPGSWTDFDEAVYDAEIHYADRALGPFLAQLQAEGAWVLFTADHGEEFGDHPGAYADEHLPEDVRHGHTLYQELIHVPLVVRGPGLAPGVVSRPVRNLDLSSTILALGGAQPLRGDGQPLAEVLGLPIPPPLPRRAQATRYGSEKRAVLDDGDKLIRTQAGDELYALDADPGERQDLAAQDPERVQALAPLLPSMGQSSSPADLDPAVLEQLRAVGYVDP